MSLFKSTKKTEFCPECQAPLHIRRGKQGLFLGCSAYPECSYLKPLQQISHIVKTLDEICPQCGKLLQLKSGHFGLFIGCSDYPNCHFIVTHESEQKETFSCPACNKHQLVERVGRSGKVFWGCEGYPECRFTLSTKPTESVLAKYIKHE
ncbi:putative DNA topoisomerase [Nicoletella semolina]|uniref:Putative DNA topoisomerase n=1 Tax=Nicoletella semolina TaxID=271160 RepID=A0A4R2N8U0_9PAST|nr:topoisomerase DNA-binding C4 zinc finger domain-containing protein [Nicoletella semolina]MDH2924473.1 hypothetical protein [Nicoletella semolina]TCP17401.1 putative DNA topoisomerase [Nicoletella semolina]